jgi:hypothetical protein
VSNLHNAAERAREALDNLILACEPPTDRSALESAVVEAVRAASVLAAAIRARGTLEHVTDGQSQSD